jgi:hypothetical protein
MSKLDPALEQIARERPHLVNEAGVTALVAEIDELREELAVSIARTARVRRELAEERTVNVSQRMDNVEAGSTVVGYVAGSPRRPRPSR